MWFSLKRSISILKSVGVKTALFGDSVVWNHVQGHCTVHIVTLNCVEGTTQLTPEKTLCLYGAKDKRFVTAFPDKKKDSAGRQEDETQVSGRAVEWGHEDILLEIIIGNSINCFQACQSLETESKYQTF